MTEAMYMQTVIVYDDQTSSWTTRQSLRELDREFRLLRRFRLELRLVAA